MKSFGSNFKKLRICKGLTQDQLVSEYNNLFKYNLTKSAISQYENNKRMPELQTLINFSNYFNVSLDYLLSLDNIQIKEDSSSYNIFPLKQEMEISKFIESIKELISLENNFTLNGESLSEETRSLLINCLEVTLELSKKTQLKGK